MLEVDDKVMITSGTYTDYPGTIIKVDPDSMYLRYFVAVKIGTCTRWVWLPEGDLKKHVSGSSSANLYFDVVHTTSQTVEAKKTKSERIKELEATVERQESNIEDLFERVREIEYKFEKLLRVLE